MTAQIRPNRLEVNDRFPMIGFTIRSDSAPTRAEVAVATDPALFQQDRKQDRTLSNFYSSRAGVPLTIPRNEAVYLLPAEILARFVGQDRLYYALATGPNGVAGSSHVDVLPTAGSPYISLRGLTGRSLKRVRLLPSRQNMASGGYNSNNGAALVWAGDQTVPGMEPVPSGNRQSTASAPTTNGGNANHNGATSVVGDGDYDDGFGPLESADTSVTSSKDATPQQQQESVAQSLRQMAAAHGNEPTKLMPPPKARARAMGETSPGASAAIRIGGVLLSRIVNNQGDVSWDLDQLNGIKHPNDQAPANPAPFRDAPTIRLTGWPTAGGLIDDIAADFSVDWQFNGRSLGNVRIGNIGVNDAIGWGLSVRAQIMDDNILYSPNNCAALRVRLYYRFTRSIGSDVIAVTDLHLFGDGTYEQSSRWEQASALGYMSRAQGNESYTLNWDEVESIAQPTDKSCWAAAAAMVVGWKERISLSPETVAQIANRTTATGLDPRQVEQFANDMGLSFEYPMSYTIDGFRQLLESSGPLWVAADVPGLHAIVVTGMYHDANNTYVRITDPWDRRPGSPGAPGAYLQTHNTGSRYILTWEAFVREYEAAATNYSTVNLQILHSGGTDGRVPNYGAPVDYAQAAASDVSNVATAPAPNTQPATSYQRRSESGSSNNATWELDQIDGMKAAPGTSASPDSSNLQQRQVNLLDWPYLSSDDVRVQLPLSVSWRYNHCALGDIRIEAGEPRTAQDWSIAVKASISDASQAEPVDGFNIAIRYVFSHPNHDDVVAMSRLALKCDGTYQREDRWLQQMETTAA